MRYFDKILHSHFDKIALGKCQTSVLSVQKFTSISSDTFILNARICKASHVFTNYYFLLSILDTPENGTKKRVLVHFDNLKNANVRSIGVRPFSQSEPESHSHNFDGGGVSEQDVEIYFKSVSLAFPSTKMTLPVEESDDE